MGEGMSRIFFSAGFSVDATSTYLAATNESEHDPRARPEAEILPRRRRGRLRAVGRPRAAGAGMRPDSRPGLVTKDLKEAVFDFRSCFDTGKKQAPAREGLEKPGLDHFVDAG